MDDIDSTSLVIWASREETELVIGLGLNAGGGTDDSFVFPGQYLVSNSYVRSVRSAHWFDLLSKPNLYFRRMHAILEHTHMYMILSSESSRTCDLRRVFDRPLGLPRPANWSASELRVIPHKI